MNSRRWLVTVMGLVLFLLMNTGSSSAQTITSGAVSGVVKDPSGAVVPNAQVELKDNAKGKISTTKTGPSGVYTFSLLEPSNYTMTVTASGFQTQSLTVSVPLGSPITMNVDLAVASGGTTVTVTEQAPLVQTQNGDAATTLTQQQVSQIPNPGNDLTYAAQLAPGVVTNTQGGYGNLEAFGMPATSNLFTLNGMDDNDPFLNLGNSGASNLLLGANEIQEADVVTTGYSGSFGTFAGVNINYITKSGGNQFHGNAIYYWNGSSLNANDWFNNQAGAPKPFSNANQWAASVGGPIKKDKMFFFLNTEGLRVLIPVGDTIGVPTQAFEQATINNLATIPGYGAGSPALAFYCTGTGGGTAALTGCPASPIPASGPTRPPAGLNAVPGSGIGAFNLFNEIPNYGTAVNNLPGGGCGGGSGIPGFSATNPCTESLRETPINFAPEWQLAGRFDWNIGSKDQMFVRMQYDDGTQPTFTDPVNPVFNATSSQPEYQGQLLETHSFSPTLTNQLLIASTWYSAIFESPDTTAAQAAFPTTLLVNDGTLPFIGGENFAFPQGRNVTQIQFQDDVAKTLGSHTLKFGAKFHKDYVSDHDFGNRLTGLEIPLDLNAFYNGGTGTNPDLGDFSIYQASYPTSLNEPIRIYELAGYAQDEWRVKRNLTVTMAFRLEHSSNPVCVTNCFGQLNGGLNGAIAGYAAEGVNYPYSTAININQRNTLNGYPTLQPEPRISFAWQPFGSASSGWKSNFVVRGGFGLFYDIFPGFVADSIAQNPPLFNSFTTSFDNLSPQASTNLITDALTANQNFETAFNTGGGFCNAPTGCPTNSTALAPDSTYTEPKTSAPAYEKWSLGVQKGFGANTSLSVGYNGNHGYHIPIANNSVNAYGFFTLPTTVPTAQFANVTGIYSQGVSNYNGLTTSFQHRFTKWTQGVLQINYTWSHAFDDVSNGGLLPFQDNATGGSATSILNPENPYNLRANYGPSDYDVRQYLNANYVYQLPVRKLFHGGGNKYLVDGWQVSGALFDRTGLPWTVIDPGVTGVNNYNGSIFPTPIGPFTTNSCNSEKYAGPGATGCVNSSQFDYNPANFPAEALGFSTGARNIFRGPSYFDTDWTIQKSTPIPGWEAGKLAIGFQFYNLFNHPNFNLPVNSISSPTFGTLESTVNTPTSILGSFLGGDASPRLIQLKASLTF
jgi:hypothetical protein